MYRTGSIIMLVIFCHLAVVSEGLCLGKKIYGFLNETFFPITQCDSMIRIKTGNNYQIYVDQLVQYPGQTEQYQQRNSLMKPNHKQNKVNQEDLLSYVQEYMNEMKKISGQAKLPKVIPIPTQQLTL